MANVKLGTKAVGSIVKIKVNGAAKDFIIVHQGLPSSKYDASCNGVWLLMLGSYTSMSFDSAYNRYAESRIHSYLNGTFYNAIDATIRSAIKTVKIPYTYYTSNGASSGYVYSGAKGLSTKVFILSVSELGCDSAAPDANVEGTRLAYFGLNGVSSWSGCWTRSSYYDRTDYIYTVTSRGVTETWYGSNHGVSPCIILPADLAVDADGKVSVNTAPEINTESTVLGEQSAPFACSYTVSDADGDSLTVTEKLDGTVTATRTGVASGTALTFGQTATEETFRRILNGSHTLEVVVSDGIESASTTAAFTKAVHKATVTLAEPLAVEGDITVAILQVSGSIPDDAVVKAEATNNALDDSPVWQDVTTEVQKGVNIVFTNSTATNGAAFNFRISVERGASGTGGYIEAVTGAFQ